MIPTRQTARINVFRDIGFTSLGPPNVSVDRAGIHASSAEPMMMQSTNRRSGPATLLGGGVVN
jgi:hypothetical protein